MKKADKMCKRFKQKQHAWSPVLVKVGSKVSYWKLRKAMSTGEIQTDDLI